MICLPVAVFKPLKLHAFLKRVCGYSGVKSGMHVNLFLIESIPFYNSLVSRKTFITSTEVNSERCVNQQLNIFA